MPFELFLALRYLKSRRKRRLARITALVAVVGIAVGVASLIVALALANGFRDEMREKILSGTAHITVARNDGEPLTENFQLAKRVESIRGVTSAFATTYDGAVIVGPKGSTYAVLRGLDTTAEPAFRSVQNSMVEGSAAKLRERSGADNTPAVLLGSELAARTGLVVGDVADVIPASVNLSNAASTTSVTKRSVYVAGLFRSGLFEYDSTWIYLSLDTARRFSGADHSATVISVQLADIYDAPRVAAAIRSALGSAYSTIDWQEANRPLFTALALERRMGLFIIALIVVIAVLNITTTLILVVVERGRDIGILSAMGAGSGSVMGIFMIEGAIIGLSGGISGVLLGLLACAIGNRFKLVSLPADVYSISYVPFHSQVRDVILAALIALLLSFVATIYPALAAARIRPVEMLRDA